METLEPLLAEFCEIKTASDRRNQILRFLDMLVHFFRYGLNSNKIMIDVFSTKAFEFAYFLSLVCICFKKDYILILHGGDLPKRFENSKRRMHQILSNAAAVVAPSAYLANFFQKKGYTIDLIPNVIELKAYSFKKRSILRPNILSIRGFGKPYNPILTLNAINKLRPKYSNIKLLMLGNSDEYFYKDVEKFIKDNRLSDIVQISPKMTKEAWVDLAGDFDIMISNPVIDNTPVSIIEGMALGMCVVSTNVGGIGYLVNEFECALVESDNEFELIETIDRILSDTTYASSLSINGRLKAEQFDWEIVGKKWESVLLRND